jgi:hypothetical protein
MENLIVLDEIFRNFKSMEQGLSKTERLSKSLEIRNGMNLTKEEMFEMQTKIYTRHNKKNESTLTII